MEVTVNLHEHRAYYVVTTRIDVTDQAQQAELNQNQAPVQTNLHLAECVDLMVLVNVQGIAISTTTQLILPLLLLQASIFKAVHTERPRGNQSQSVSHICPKQALFSRSR